LFGVGVQRGQSHHGSIAKGARGRALGRPEFSNEACPDIGDEFTCQNGLLVTCPAKGEVYGRTSRRRANHGPVVVASLGSHIRRLVNDAFLNAGRFVCQVDGIFV
jgi:hypothetical protein